MRTVFMIMINFLPILLFGQQLTSTIRGSVIDGFTNSPLEGATIVLVDSLKQYGTITDENGSFSFNDIPVGRQTVAVTFVGYKIWVAQNLIVTSGKEVVLNVRLEEDAQLLDEVVVKAQRASNTKNSYSYVSGRTFSVEDTERYSGTNGDPARMATYFAGVMAAGDTRNDIIIRGNSPLGLLWRIEGVDIPNPSHFASMGTNGGAMSILNNNQLANSDFLSGAFPAQYGNALSGVFDLHLRNGNSQKRETTIQMGSGGLEAGFEGYFSKKSDASYLINYRYSFIELFDVLGIDLEIPSVPKYQDLSFKVNLPSQQFGRLSLWGLGGKSSMNMLAENNILNATKNINTSFGSDMGAVGISHSLTMNENSFLKTSFAATGFTTSMGVDSVRSSSEIVPFYGNKYTEGRLVATTVFKHRVNGRLRFEAGATFTNSTISFNDSANVNNQYIYLARNSGNYSLIQGFSQFEYKISQNVKLSTGLFTQLLTLNNSKSLEPRLALNWQVNPKSSIYIGQGLHSQVLQGNIYFHKTLVDTVNHVYLETNRNLDFTKSYHSVIGFKHNLSQSTWLKAEAYYQHLYNVPVENRPTAYSVLNFGADYHSVVEDSLINKGLGRNIGVEFTLERLYTKGFYYLATLSLYESKYRGSDNVWRNTMFNGNYIFNLLGGYEFKLPKNESLAINANLVWAGGLRYIPIDLDQSRVEGKTVLNASNPYVDKNRDFFKMNIKLIYRINRSRYSYETGFGINNISNRKNIMMQSYNHETGLIVKDYQLGLMPEGLFRIYF